MSEPNNSAWPFSEITESEGFDIDAIFGTGNSAASTCGAGSTYGSRCSARTGSCRCSCCPGTQGSCTCEGCCGSSCGKPHCRGL